MTTKQKKKAIKKLAKEMLKESYKDMQSKVEKALNSGCIDIESWDPTYSKMITPKTIVAAILKNESTQYDAKGTSFEKQVKKEINNIRLFI